MKNFIIAALALGVSVSAASNENIIVSVETGNVKTFSKFTVKDYSNGGYYHFYGIGIIDAIAGAYKRSDPPTICLPKNTVLGDIVKSVDDFIAQNKDVANAEFAGVVQHALISNYWCDNDVTQYWLRIMQKHPDVFAIMSSDYFFSWLKAKGKDYETKAKSNNFADIIELLNEYKRHLYK